MQKLHFDPDVEKGVPTLTSLPLSLHTSQRLSEVLNEQGCAECWFHWSTNVISQLPAINAVTLPGLAVLPHASQYAPHCLHALLFSLVRHQLMNSLSWLTCTFVLSAQSLLPPSHLQPRCGLVVAWRDAGGLGKQKAG